MHAKGDKLIHFGISVLFGAAGESHLHYATELNGNKRVFFGTILETLPGLFKELFDSAQMGYHFSGDDLAADVLGSFLGALLSNMVNNKIQVKTHLNIKRQFWVVSIRFTL